MTTIVLDGLNEEDFRRSIENRLREGRSGAAIERIRSLLAHYAGPGRILPERFLTVESADLALIGWDRLGDAVARHDRPGSPVTALTIAFGWPGEEVPEYSAEGWLRPHIETSYFNDDAFPFSQSGREDLLEGYSYYGCTWSGDCEAADTVLTLEGLDDLHGALATLEAHLLATDEPDEECVRAGSLGACLLSALLVQAVTERIARDGLPRPLCVMAGSSGVYPYFDAPVAGISEAVRKEPVVVPAALGSVTVDLGVPIPRYSSLLMTGIPRAKKRAVLVLEESDDELENRVAGLRSHDLDDGEGGDTQIEPAATDPEFDLPDPVTAAAGNGPLLAKKSAREAWDFRDMLSPRQPGLPADGAPARDRIDVAEPALPPTRGELPVGPGFTLLEPDMQQRLQTLLSGQAQPVEAAPLTPPPIPVELPAPLAPVKTVEQAAPTDLPRHLLAWMRDKVKGCLAKFGR